MICLRVSVLSDFPTHAYLQVFKMASCSLLHSVRRIAVGQFLDLLLTSVTENICVCSEAVMADHFCLGL